MLYRSWLGTASAKTRSPPAGTACFLLGSGSPGPDACLARSEARLLSPFLPAWPRHSSPVCPGNGGALCNGSQTARTAALVPPVRPRVLLSPHPTPEFWSPEISGWGKGEEACALPFVRRGVMLFLLSFTSEVRGISCGVAGQMPHGLGGATWSPAAASALGPGKQGELTVSRKQAWAGGQHSRAPARPSLQGAMAEGWGAVGQGHWQRGRAPWGCTLATPGWIDKEWPDTPWP